MIPLSWLQEARGRIAPHISQTPLQYDQELDIYLKWENRQITGSFKVRGAFNKALTLQDWERQGGLAAASAGNHGQGLALAGKVLGATVTIFASEHAVPTKVEAMRRLGAQVRLVPGGYNQAEKAGKIYAQETGATWISPYNDGQVIAGQGTVGLEMLEQLPPLERSAWLVPASGGGLLAGVGAAIKETPGAGGRRLVGVQTAASPFLHGLFYHGTQAGLVELPSLADGLAGAVEEGSVTIPLVQRYTDEIVLVSEEEVKQAIAYAWHRYGERIEGSAAVTVAAILSGKIKDRPAALVITGGNIQPQLHAEIIQAHGHHPR